MKYKLNKKNLKYLYDAVEVMNEEFKYEGSSDKAFVLICEKEKYCTIGVLRKAY